VVRLLLARQGVEVNQSKADGATALIIASQKGHVEVVRVLLARQCVEVNKRVAEGSTALMIASQHGQVGVVHLLLARQGVEVNQTNALGSSALTFTDETRIPPTPPHASRWHELLLAAAHDARSARARNLVCAVSKR
jgi:ankyrin repeat protein